MPFARGSFSARKGLRCRSRDFASELRVNVRAIGRDSRSRGDRRWNAPQHTITACERYAEKRGVSAPLTFAQLDSD